ncbi:MAG: XRE family transcriptional regulator [Magnetococcales bacterium]|nr:XRE family transcriptional regulator [Magnetococcales bacterium]
MTNPHIGSDFDAFLIDEGLLAEVEAVAVKRVFAFQVARMMEEQNLSKSEMARRMKTSRAALDRLLDPENRSITLRTMEGAAAAMGARLHVELVPAA